ADLDLRDATVALVHYGERNTALAEALRQRGAEARELSLYEWQLPPDLGPLQTLTREIIDGRVDVVAFTSQVQIRHLMQVAAGIGQDGALVQALNGDTVVAAVGPTCAAALRDYGITP